MIANKAGLHNLKRGSHTDRFSMALLLFNIYNHDLQVQTSSKYAYADNLALLHCAGNCQAIERVFKSKHDHIVSVPPEEKLKLSETKMGSVVLGCLSKLLRIKQANSYYFCCYENVGIAFLFSVSQAI